MPQPREETNALRIVWAKWPLEVKKGIRAFAQGPRSPAKDCLRIRAVRNQVTKLKVTFLRNAVSSLHPGVDRQFCGYSVNGCIPK